MDTLDIVDRLRGAISDEDNDGQLLEDAADEIVRLRYEIESLQDELEEEWQDMAGASL